jgi:phosphohistidine phosphatase
MERRLLIIRHGKSSWEEEGLNDTGRPLADRGIKSAELMARRLMKAGMIPELVYSSPAKRALDTALIMVRLWELVPSALEIHEELYMADPSEIGEVVGGVPDKVTCLAIFGHNPSFTIFANRFLSDPIDNLPTAGVVGVTFDSKSWKRISRENVSGTFVDCPKKGN